MNATAPQQAIDKTRTSQSVVPAVSFFQAQRIAQAIWDELAGVGGRPIDVAAAMGVQAD